MFLLFSTTISSFSSSSSSSSSSHHWVGSLVGPFRSHTSRSLPRFFCLLVQRLQGSNPTTRTRDPFEGNSNHWPSLTVSLPNKIKRMWIKLWTGQVQVNKQTCGQWSASHKGRAAGLVIWSLYCTNCPWVSPRFQSFDPFVNHTFTAKFSSLRGVCYSDNSILVYCVMQDSLSRRASTLSRACTM
jgi:hypothetical protein